MLPTAACNAKWYSVEEQIIANLTVLIKHLCLLPHVLALSIRTSSAAPAGHFWILGLAPLG